MNKHHLATIWKSLLHGIFGDCRSSRSLFGSFTCMFLECYFHKVHVKIENLFFVLIKEGKIPKKFNIGIFFFPPSGKVTCKSYSILKLTLGELPPVWNKAPCLPHQERADQKSSQGTWHSAAVQLLRKAMAAGKDPRTQHSCCTAAARLQHGTVFCLQLSFYHQH